jgi:hypothetical protein
MRGKGVYHHTLRPDSSVVKAPQTTIPVANLFDVSQILIDRFGPRPQSWGDCLLPIHIKYDLEEFETLKNTGDVLVWLPRIGDQMGRIYLSDPAL